MRATALKAFRQPPARLNCAQAVLYAWQEVSGDRSVSLADVKAFAGGRAPGGLCGALYVACLVAPKHADSLKSAFARQLGSPFCRELRATGNHVCSACVAEAAELLATRPR